MDKKGTSLFLGTSRTRRFRLVLFVCFLCLATFGIFELSQDAFETASLLPGESEAPPAGERVVGTRKELSLGTLPSPTHSNGRIHFITVQTGPTPTWCRMLLSAHLSGNISVVNLAWGQKYAHIKRPEWILDFLKTLQDENVVVFSDGGDTIYTGLDPGHISQTFRQLTADDEAHHNVSAVVDGTALPPVLFNAEANCYHQQTFSGSWGVKKGKCLSAYKRYDPNVTSPYRYLNGGAWIARVWAAKKVFSAAADIIKLHSFLWCDQSVLGGILLSGKFRGILGLDKANHFFLPTYHLRANRDFCDDEKTSATDAARPQLRMCHSHQTPAIVHFNGKSEGKFTAEVLRRTGWARGVATQKDRDARVASAKQAITYLGPRISKHVGELCHSLVFPV